MTELKRGTSKDFKLPIPILFFCRFEYGFFAQEKRGRSDTEMTSTQEKSGKRCVSPSELSNPESAQKLFVSLPCLRQENFFL